MLSELRVGKFTSSSIHNLMKKGRGGAPSVATATYIEEKIMEKRLGKQLNADVSSRPTIWGHVVEQKLYSLLDPFEYQYCSEETIVHPEISSWAGTPDFLTKEKVCDGKCPYTLKAFCQLADISIAHDVEKLKATKPEYYWQLVSNAILTGRKTAELITYCPYQSELASIREMVENYDENQVKYSWIYFSEDEDLPFLIEGGYYRNLYKLEFEVPQEDIVALTSAVVEAKNQLEVI
jgi:hypothetical protein